MGDNYFEKSTLALGLIATVVMLIILTAVMIWG
jgi:hypothetical protein